MIRVDYDPLPDTTAGPVRIVIGPAWHRLTLAQARELHEQMGRVLAQAEPIPDTERPQAPPEPQTTPGTQEARRRSSDRLAAVQLPERGLDARVEAELAKGRP